jgi:serine/threonine protein kinase
MTGEPLSGNTEELFFRRVTGEVIRVAATVGTAESRAGEFLTARSVRLNDGTELRQLRVAAGSRRGAGYDRLDNEILAGRRLYEVARDVGYPAALSRLYGDEAASADPCALLEPYRGEPLHAVVRQMMDDEQRDFEISLLTGLCWLEAAGIAHRGLSPASVWWDGRTRQVQITDFSLCTVFGVPREAIGPSDWVGPEQRPGGKVSGLVTKRDDMHAAGRLIYYVRSQGERLRSRGQLAEVGLADLDPLFGPPDSRPAARELLADRLGGGDPVPRGTDGDALLEDGHELFDLRRREKRHGIADPEDRRDAGSRAAAGMTRASGDSAGAPDMAATPPVPLESAQAGPVRAETVEPRQPRGQGKRPIWRRGGRS